MSQGRCGQSSGLCRCGRGRGPLVRRKKWGPGPLGANAQSSPPLALLPLVLWPGPSAWPPSLLQPLGPLLQEAFPDRPRHCLWGLPACPAILPLKSHPGQPA